MIGPRHFVALLCFLFCGWPVQAQYILNGDARQVSCNCYTLTQPATTQSGSVWNGNRIDLRQSFDFWFNVYLGCNDAGADGIVFMLQPISTSVGTSGEGMGFGGVSPSIGIALDTYQNNNLNDPSYDHISIQRDGLTNHNTDLAGPVRASATADNIEDCQWHRLRIQWDATTTRLRAYFDGSLRLETRIDLVGTVFNNNPFLYWGFSGATGGFVNLQQFCTALDPLFTTTPGNNLVCEGSPITFRDASESFAPLVAYHWRFGDGAESTERNPPPHLYARPGRYPVTLRIKALDGCERDSTFAVTVAAIPAVALNAADACEGTSPALQVTTDTTGTTALWSVNGTAAPPGQLPPLQDLPPGTHNLAVTVESRAGCGAPASAAVPLVVKPGPVLALADTAGCTTTPLELHARQLDAATSIANWNWLVDEQRFNTQTPRLQFARPGVYTARVWASGTNGCASDTAVASLTIGQAVVQVRDTVLVRNRPAQLQVTANGQVVWQPATGLSNPLVTNPVATLANHQQYTVTVTTAEGCTDAALMQVRVYNGPTVYVPTAFTPNADGRNDRLQPVYVGIGQLQRFAVYDRWGRQVFVTTDRGGGWDGASPPGMYVWLVQATTDKGEPVVLKGTVLLLR